MLKNSKTNDSILDLVASTFSKKYLPKTKRPQKSPQVVKKTQVFVGSSRSQLEIIQLNLLFLEHRGRQDRRKSGGKMENKKHGFVYHFIIISG